MRWQMSNTMRPSLSRMFISMARLNMKTKKYLYACAFKSTGTKVGEVMPDWSAATPLVSNPYWGYNPGALDVCAFNNSRYMALFEMDMLLFHKKTGEMLPFTI